MPIVNLMELVFYYYLFVCVCSIHCIHFTYRRLFLVITFRSIQFGAKINWIDSGLKFTSKMGSRFSYMINNCVQTSIWSCRFYSFVVVAKRAVVLKFYIESNVLTKNSICIWLKIALLQFTSKKNSCAHRPSAYFPRYTQPPLHTSNRCRFIWNRNIGCPNVNYWFCLFLFSTLNWEYRSKIVTVLSVHTNV